MYTQSNNHLHCSISRYPCGGIWLWQVSDVVVTTDKTVWGNTGIYMMCFEVKRDVTPHISACIIYGHFFIGSCWITLSFSFEMCLNLYFSFHFTRLFAVCTSVYLFTPDDLNNVFMLLLTVFIHFEITTSAQSKITVTDDVSDLHLQIISF